MVGNIGEDGQLKGISDGSSDDSNMQMSTNSILSKAQIGPDGLPILGPNGELLGEDGKPLVGPNGELLGPDGKPLLGPNGELLGADGKPLLGPNGEILVGFKTDK